MHARQSGEYILATLGEIPMSELGRTESKLPQLCLLEKETIRSQYRLLIHTHPKKNNPEEDEFTESEQELISGHDEPQTIQEGCQSYTTPKNNQLCKVFVSRGKSD